MDTKISALTEKQCSLVCRAQLSEMGLSRAQIAHLLRRGVLQRVRPRVYAVAGAAPSWEQGLLAAVLSVGERAVASHSSAARMWTWTHRPDDRYEVTVARDIRPRLRGVTIHRTTRLDETDIVTRFEVPVTSYERTLCDCTTVLSEFQLGRVLDDGLRRGVASLRNLKECAERLESGPGRHMSVIRALLAHRGVAYDPGGSASELRVLDTIAAAGLPRPDQQVRVRVGGRTYKLDLAWRQQKVFAEYYGLAVHSGVSAVAYDNARLTALATAGWLPLVFTDKSSDREIVEGTARALAQRDVGTLRGA